MTSPEPAAGAALGVNPPQTLPGGLGVAAGVMSRVRQLSAQCQALSMAVSRVWCHRTAGFLGQMSLSQQEGRFWGAATLSVGATSTIPLPFPTCTPKRTRSPAGLPARPGGACCRLLPAAWHGCCLLNCAESTTDGRTVSRCSFATFGCCWAPSLQEGRLGRAPCVLGGDGDPSCGGQVWG